MLCITTFLLEWLCYKLVFHFSGTPDFHSEESDSSSGSVLRRSTAEASKTLSEEWNRIERTLYSEDGEKSTRPNILEECKQWRQLHPQLRWVREYNLLHEYLLTFQIWQFKKKLCVLDICLNGVILWILRKKKIHALISHHRLSPNEWFFKWWRKTLIPEFLVT